MEQMTAPRTTPERQDSMVTLLVLGLLAANDDDFAKCHAVIGRLGLGDVERIRERLARLDNSLRAREEMIR